MRVPAIWQAGSGRELTQGLEGCCGVTPPLTVREYTMGTPECAGATMGMRACVIEPALMQRTIEPRMTLGFADRSATCERVEVQHMRAGATGGDLKFW